MKFLSKLFPSRSASVTAEAWRILKRIDLGPEDVVIDCGANVGDITTVMAQTGAIVHDAFEPNPNAFAVLTKRTDGMSNVHCYPKAVLDENKPVKLYLHEYTADDPVKRSRGSSLLGYKAALSEDNFVEVEAVDLCAFIEALSGRVRFVKIDVEGVECPIIRKLIESGIIDRVDLVYAETHDEKVPELKQETDGLRELIRERGLGNKVHLDWP